MKHTSAGAWSPSSGARRSCSRHARQRRGRPRLRPSPRRRRPPRSRRRRRPPRQPRRRRPHPPRPAAIAVGYLPKDIVNQYFAAAKTGVDKAAAELGGTVTQVGPNEAKADLQIPFITDMTTKGVDAIIISADGKDEVAPALKAAMDAGIKVVGFDSSPAVGAYNVFVNQADFSGVGTGLVDWTCEIVPDCTGDFAILSAAATATNQNSVDRRHEDDAREPTPKYAGLKLVDTVYGDDDATKSTTQAQGLLTKYPNLKAIVAPTTVGDPRRGAGRRRRRASRTTSRSPASASRDDMRPFVHDGTSPGVRPVERPRPRLPLLRRRRQAGQGRDHGRRRRDVHRPEPQRWPAVHDRRRTASITLGPPFRFDKDNVDARTGSSF